LASDAAENGGLCSARTGCAEENGAPLMSRRVTFTIISLVLALSMTLPSGLVLTISAAMPHDQAVGMWNYTCRVNQINTYETITVGADTSGQLGNQSGFASRVCNAFLDASPTTNNHGYEVFPLTVPRPGAILCSYVYRYGGYWELLLPPYARSRGAAIITIRDTTDDIGDSSNAVTYGQQDCNDVGYALNLINLRNGYNVTDQPLATVEACSACGGGGSLSTVVLPPPPKPKHPTKKPLTCTTSTVNGKTKRTCHR